MRLKGKYYSAKIEKNDMEMGLVNMARWQNLAAVTCYPPPSYFVIEITKNETRPEGT